MKRPYEAETTVCAPSPEQPEGTTVETSDRQALIAERVRAYLAAGTRPDLTGQPWDVWGEPGPYIPYVDLQCALARRLHQAVDVAAIRTDDPTDPLDPAYVADVDMDAAWIEACAGHVVEWTSKQIAEHLHQFGPSERVAELTRMHAEALRVTGGYGCPDDCYGHLTA